MIDEINGINIRASTKEALDALDRIKQWIQLYHDQCGGNCDAEASLRLLKMQKRCSMHHGCDFGGTCDVCGKIIKELVYEKKVSGC